MMHLNKLICVIVLWYASCTHGVVFINKTHEPIQIRELLFSCNQETVVEHVTVQPNGRYENSNLVSCTITIHKQTLPLQYLRQKTFVLIGYEKVVIIHLT
jgi:hypothetical protein